MAESPNPPSAPSDIGTTAAGAPLPDLTTLTYEEAVGLLPEAIRNAIDTIRAEIEIRAGKVIANIASGLLALIAAPFHLAPLATGTILGTAAAYREAGLVSGRSLVTPSVVDPLATVQLFFKGKWALGGLLEEMSRNGFSADRALALIEAQRPDPSEADLLKAVVRKLLTPGEATNKLDNKGYTPGDAELLIKLARDLLSIGDIVALWLRGEISDAEITQKLSEHGYNDADISHLRSLAFYIPPVPDLVRMAVREAFDDAAAAKLTLDAEFPPDFATNAKKQGVSQEWAQKYWRAHWELPSPTQAYEMLHRGLISEQELADLLKALDYAPTWRDKLQAISYNTLTRVDVRRMYALGIIDEAGVTRAYLDGGYNQENADRLTQFVVADTLAAQVSPVRARLLTLFRKGIVSESAIRELLTALKMPVSQQDILIANEYILAAAEALERRLNLIRGQYVNGVISDAEMAVAITAVGIPAESIPEYIAQFKMARSARVTRLPLRDLKEAYQGGFISRERARESLEARNMVPGDVDIWLDIYAPAPVEEPV